MAEKEYISIQKLLELKNNFYDFGHYDLGDLDMFLEDIKEHFVDALVIPEGGVGEVSDGYHTFNELYRHRAILFSVICNAHPDKAWKSKLHDTGDMFEGMFIVGIKTPQGHATYHYDIEPYWDMFKVIELERAPKWDGHTPEQAIERIKMLEAVGKIPRWIPTSERLPDAELEEYLKKYPIMNAVEVIGKIKGSDEATVLYYDGERFLDFFDDAYIVSHWMPMPKAPEETESAEVLDAERECEAEVECES